MKKDSGAERENAMERKVEVPLQAKPRKRSKRLVLIASIVVLVALAGFSINYYGIVDFKELIGSSISSARPVEKEKIRLSITKKGQDSRVAKRQSTPSTINKTRKRKTKTPATIKTPDVKKRQDNIVARKLSTPSIAKETAKRKTKTPDSLIKPTANKGPDIRVAKKPATPSTVKQPGKTKTIIKDPVQTPKSQVTTPRVKEKPSVPVHAGKGPDKKISERTKMTSSYPYSVYLGSFRTLQGVHQTVSQSRKMGLSPYWIKLDLGDKGTWFRIFAGYFETRKGADTFIKVRNIKGAESRHTKYANLIGTYTSAGALDGKKTALLELGYSPYVINDERNEKYLYVGAFYQLVRAEKQNAALASKGIQSQLVRR